MVDSGQLRRTSILSIESVRRFIEEGIAFESTVRSSAEMISTDEAPAIGHDGEPIVLGTPVLENEDLGLYGSPDGVWGLGGTMAPVEVKSHKQPTRLDEIELCFYWDLLSPWRDHPERAFGFLVLPDGADSYRLVHVELTDNRFKEMSGLVDAVRRARTVPPKSRVCSCLVCSRIESQRVIEECRARGDLTLVAGLGRKYAHALEDSGISDLTDLRRQEPDRLVRLLRERGYGISMNQASRWIHHAEAFHLGKPVFFGEEPFDHSEFITLDLEYDTWQEGNPIWLAGAEITTRDGRQVHSFWADPGEERLLLNRLFQLLVDKPRLPIIMWNGHSADVPQLRKACERWQLPELMTEINRRQVDLYLYVLNSIRFPIERLQLKVLGAQLGLVRDPLISNGLEATSAWSVYKKSIGTSKGLELRKALIRYNADDVVSLTETASAVRDLTLELAARQS